MEFSQKNIVSGFKSADHLFARIKDQFISYENSGLLDEGMWYTDIKYILGVLGSSWYTIHETVVDIEKYNAKLPSNFLLLDYALRVDKESSTCIEDKSLIVVNEVFDYLQYDADVHNYNPCTPCCKVYPNPCVFGKREAIYLEKDNLYHKYSNPTLLKLGNVSTRSFCTEELYLGHARCEDTITIQNNKIYTNFRNGSVYLSYRAFPIDIETGLPLIPDDVIIEKAIENYIKYNIVGRLIINKEADLTGVYSLYLQEYKAALSDALFETKVPTFNTLLKEIRKKDSKFNQFNYRK